MNTEGAAASPSPDEFEAAMSEYVTGSITSRRWSAIAVAGNEALKPIAAFLSDMFGVEDTAGIVLIVCRSKGKPAENGGQP